LPSPWATTYLTIYWWIALEIHRLQIKTTITEEQDKSRTYGFALNHGKDSSSYHADTVDFFGLVILPLHTIYIAPQASVDDRMKVYVYPENPGSAGLLERYRQNWGLL